MSTEKVAVHEAADGWESPLEPEHLSLVPLVGAVGAIVSGVENGWTVAALLLALAYLFVYVRSRRRSGGVIGCHRTLSTSRDGSSGS